MSYRSSRVYVAPVPKMPPGLIELMEGLSKDVLRNNPINIYEFCADHMEKLLRIRDKKCKNTLSLQQKIIKAQEVIRDRAKQRRKNYDHMLQQQLLESENDVGNSSNKNVKAIHIQQADTKALEETLDVKSADVVDVSGETKINSEKENGLLLVSPLTQEIAENNLPIDICKNTTLENLSGIESNHQDISINFEALGINNITDMENVDMGTDEGECTLKDITQSAYTNENQDVISENTITGQNEESSIFESKDNNKETCSTGESNNINTQSFIKGEDINSAVKIPNNCQTEEDKPNSENNFEKKFNEENNDNNVQCAEELDNNSNNEVAQHNVMDLETAAITIQKVFRTLLSLFSSLNFFSKLFSLLGLSSSV